MHNVLDIDFIFGSTNWPVIKYSVFFPLILLEEMRRLLDESLYETLLI